MPPDRLLILGNSAAGLAAARAIRARGTEHHVTIVSREACSAYSPVLTTYYLHGRIPESALYLCDVGSYHGLDIDCRFGKAAVLLDTKARRVTLDDQSSLPYDKLLIATGASPKRLGGDLESEVAAEICYLRMIGDARRIRRAALGARHLVVLGAGLVSLQVAAAVARKGLKVTCIVASQQILSQNVDAACAELLRQHIEHSADIEFLFGTNVVEIAKAKAGYRIRLDSGHELSADLLVAGKGIAPNIEYVDRNQIDMDAGILVDQQLHTSVPNVFAAGDLAQGVNRISGRSELVPNWINACEQGRVAGAVMADAEATFAGSVPENITTLFGAPVASIGITRSREGDGLRETTYIDEARGVYRKLFIQDGRLVGAVLLRGIEDAGVIRNAIVTGSELGCSEQEAVAGRVAFADRMHRCLAANAFS
jgi:NAD(P)H-nitrite reductase large subunit